MLYFPNKPGGFPAGGGAPARAPCDSESGGVNKMTSKRFAMLGLLLGTAAAFVLPLAASAQVVPDTVDPYELAPQNIHLYPISLNARMPYYYLPPIFAPTPMWRGALTAADVQTFAPHNYVVYEIPDSTGLVAWGTSKKGQPKTLEAANQQQFMILPPSKIDDGSSYDLITVSMRYLPKCTANELKEMFQREVLLEPSRVSSIADSLPVDQLLTNFERVEDVADIQPRMHESLKNELATQAWPVEQIYINYSGWRRDPNRIRTLGDYVSNWFTCEGKLLALKHYEGGDYLVTVKWEGYQPWYPIEVAKNVMRKTLALSFDEFVETTRYYDVELPLDGKEWFRVGSPQYDPNDTRRNVGGGSAGQGMY
jgi:hypothetical protein